MRYGQTACYNRGMEERADNSAVVTLETFSARVGCHFTTASRLRAGERLPGRRLLGRIVKEHQLDAKSALDAFTAGPEEFGAFLREHVFNAKVDADDEDEESAGAQYARAS